MSTVEQHAEDWHAILQEEKLTAELTADADDRAAQLAMSIESVADEIGELYRHVEELRADVAEQRQVLEGLSALRRQSPARVGTTRRTPPRAQYAGVGLVLGGGLGATLGLILGGLPGLLVASGVGTIVGLLVGAVIDAFLAGPVQRSRGGAAL